MTDNTIDRLASDYGLSPGAVRVLLQALQEGGGTLAQFNHPELGGMGQWSRGGLTMIGDMFNAPLKDKVAALSSELAELLAGGTFETAPQKADHADRWWGADLGQFSANGSQNNIRYAYFPAARRLAVQGDGGLTIYDTGEHEISGVSQQQSKDTSLRFTSQHGAVPVETLRVVEKR